MTAKAMDADSTKQCLALLDQWRASGLDASTFEQQHDLKPGRLRAWLVHERRWRARLAGQPYISQRSQAPQAHAAKGFVALTLPPSHTHSIHIECKQGPRSATLHWPLDSSNRCAQWLREFLA